MKMLDNTEIGGVGGYDKANCKLNGNPVTLFSLFNCHIPQIGDAGRGRQRKSASSVSLRDQGKPGPWLGGVREETIPGWRAKHRRV